MAASLFRSGPFVGVDRADSFAVAATAQSPVVVKLGSIAWPAGLAPTAAPLGAYAPGETITGPAAAPTDVLVLIYTEYELMALLEVFTGDSDWTPARRRTWNGYAHNFAKFKPTIENIGEDVGLKDGLLGYLSALTIGGAKVTLFKSELHPKGNGPGVPFIPVIQQLVGELAPRLVISTGTAGAIGPNIRCGDVVVTTSARFHLQGSYPAFPALNTLSASGAAISNAASFNPTYLAYAAANLTALSLPGLTQCHAALTRQGGYGFVAPPTAPPNVYAAATTAAPGPEPMAIVSADYLTVDDVADTEGLQALGILNDTDDAFAFYAIDQLPAASRPAWLSVRNASEPQIQPGPFPAGATTAQKISEIKGLAGAIYGVYQYCTTLNSAFACWGVIAGMGGAA